MLSRITLEVAYQELTLPKPEWFQLQVLENIYNFDGSLIQTINSIIHYNSNNWSQENYDLSQKDGEDLGLAAAEDVPQ